MNPIQIPNISAGASGLLIALDGMGFSHNAIAPPHQMQLDGWNYGIMGDTHTGIYGKPARCFWGIYD